MLRWKFQYSMQPAISCPCEFQAAAYSTSPYKYQLRRYWNVDWLLKSAILMPRLPSRPSHLRLALPLRIPQSAPAVLVSNLCRTLYVRLTYSSSMHNSIRVLHFERQLTQGCWHWNGHIDLHSTVSFLPWSLQDTSVFRFWFICTCRFPQLLKFKLAAHLDAA